MSRFSPGKVSPLLFAFAIPAIVLVFAVVVIVARGGGKFGGLAVFPYEKYLGDAESLRGNTYLIRGEIDRRLASKDGRGAVIAVKLLDDTSHGRVPVFVPEQAGRNLDVGQRFNIRVTVRRDTIVAEEMEKL